MIGKCYVSGIYCLFDLFGKKCDTISLHSQTTPPINVKIATNAVGGKAHAPDAARQTIIKQAINNSTIRIKVEIKMGYTSLFERSSYFIKLYCSLMFVSTDFSLSTSSLLLIKSSNFCFRSGSM